MPDKPETITESAETSAQPGALPIETNVAPDNASANTEPADNPPLSRRRFLPIYAITLFAVAALFILASYNSQQSQEHAAASESLARSIEKLQGENLAMISQVELLEAELASETARADELADELKVVKDREATETSAALATRKQLEDEIAWLKTMTTAAATTEGSTE